VRADEIGRGEEEDDPEMQVIQEEEKLAQFAVPGKPSSQMKKQKQDDGLMSKDELLSKLDDYNVEESGESDVDSVIGEGDDMSEFGLDEKEERALDMFLNPSPTKKESLADKILTQIGELENFMLIPKGRKGGEFLGVYNWI